MDTTALPDAPTEHKPLLAWVEEIAALTEPQAIHWCDGSAEEYEQLCGQLVAAGTFAPALRRHAAQAPTWRSRTPATWRGSRTARSSARPPRRRPGRPTTGVTPRRCARTLGELFAGSMRGRTMYVVPFSMGPLGSDKSHVGVQLTDSAVRGGEHAHHDPHGPARRSTCSARTAASSPACTPSACRSPKARPTCRGRATPRTSTSCTSPRRARSGPTAPATAATRCSARSASRCASPR